MGMSFYTYTKTKPMYCMCRFNIWAMMYNSIVKIKLYIVSPETNHHSITKQRLYSDRETYRYAVS